MADVNDDMTKDELYERAQELDIEGRSSMDKDELLRAIRDHEADPDNDVREPIAAPQNAEQQEQGAQAQAQTSGQQSRPQAQQVQTTQQVPPSQPATPETAQAPGQPQQSESVEMSPPDQARAGSPDTAAHTVVHNEGDSPTGAEKVRRQQ